MHRGSSQKKALLIALSVCVVLATAFFYFVFSGKLERFDSETLLLVSVPFIIGLLTVVTYQSIRISDSARLMAQTLAKDILLYSHELFSELYRNSPVPYILVDEHGRIESTNYAAVRLFHIKEGELDEQNIFTYLECDDEMTLGLISEKLKQGIFVNEEEIRVRRLDGSTRWVLLSLFSFKDNTKKRKGLLTLVDITKQKEIDKAKTEFVSLASHQLRTPISAMKWNVELLHTANPQSFSPLQEDYLIKIARGLSRMELLIEDFLNVSKLELGTMKNEMSELQLAPFIIELLEEHRKNAESKHISLIFEPKESEFTITSDTHLLSMIIGNLVSNAIKYTPNDGTVRLTSSKEAKTVVITVSDTGIGIPDDDKDQIFTKIFRASNARENVTDGTGLGLYIVREAARVLGGDVTFISEEGRGTTFTVVLPI